MLTSPDAFFSFFKILVFWVVRLEGVAWGGERGEGRGEGGGGSRGQKMAQNDKTNLSHSVSQEVYRK